MKVEVRCGNCAKAFLIDETATGDFPCPACAAMIVVGPRPSPAPVPVPASTAPPAAAEAKVPVAAPVPAATEEIICPRCKLHFVPGRAAVETPEKDRLTVLVVEDMNYFREIARDALAEEYEVKTAETVAEAKAALVAGGVDLLVIDLTLDGGDHGIDLLRGLSVKPCPILIYTAQDESEMYGDSWDELQQLGADDMVIKGMNVGESLVRKVGTLLGKNWKDEA